MTRWKPIFSNNLYILKTILNQPESMFSSHPLAPYFQETMIWAAHFGHSINSWPVARMPFHKHRWWSLWRPFGCCIEGLKTGDVCYQGYGMRSPVFFFELKKRKGDKGTKQNSKPIFDGKCLAPRNKVRPSQIHPSWDWMNGMGYVPLSNPSSKDLGTFLLALAWHIWWHKESHNKNQKAKRNSKDAMLKVYLALEKKWVGLLSCHKRLRKIFRPSLNHTSHNAAAVSESCQLRSAIEQVLPHHLQRKDHFGPGIPCLLMTIMDLRTRCTQVPGCISWTLEGTFDHGSTFLQTK